MVVRTAGAGLRRLAEVAVMRATDFGNLHDPARLGELDGPDGVNYTWRAGSSARRDQTSTGLLASPAPAGVE